MANQKRVPGKLPIEEAKRTDSRKEKRWKEDVREKTEVKAIGQ